MTRSFDSTDILLVEDSQTDVLITREALEMSHILNALHVVEDGVEAMSFLRNSGKFKNSPRPGLILLDLNLPRKDGREVLAEIKNDPMLRGIPIVILTTSRSEKDITQAYNLHANCFVTKPLSFDLFTEAVKNIVHFWFSVVALPKAN